MATVTAKNVIAALKAAPRKRLLFPELKRKFPGCDSVELYKLVISLQNEGKVRTFSDQNTVN